MKLPLYLEGVVVPGVFEEDGGFGERSSPKRAESALKAMLQTKSISIVVQFMQCVEGWACLGLAVR